jgi:3-oxoacyl-[acyl-carrier protein] reductase
MTALVVVTGAASGIGAATARLAAERGYAVALLDRDDAGVQAGA